METTIMPEYKIIMNIFKFHIEDYLYIPQHDDSEEKRIENERLKNKADAFLHSVEAKIWADEINLDLDYVLKRVKENIKN
jgi:hypothetical protein